MFERFIKGRSLELAKKTALHLLSEKGETNAQSMATKLLETFHSLDRADQLSFFEFMAASFSPDPRAVLAAAQRYADKPDHTSLSNLFRTVEPARQELLRRLNRGVGGTHAIVQMRERLLGHLKAHPGLKSVDSDIQHVFSSWFNPGFLELHEITWSSPAILLEKSSSTSQFMPSMAGTICADDYNQTAGVLLFSSTVTRRTADFCRGCPGSRDRAGGWIIAR